MVIGASFGIVGFLAKTLSAADAYEELFLSLPLLASLRSVRLGISELFEMGRDPYLDRCVLA